MIFLVCFLSLLFILLITLLMTTKNSDRKVITEARKMTRKARDFLEKEKKKSKDGEKLSLEELLLEGDNKLKNYVNEQTLKYDISEKELEQIILENLGDPNSFVAMDISEYALNIPENLYRKYFYFFEHSIIIDRYQQNQIFLAYNPEKIFSEIIKEKFDFEKWNKTPYWYCFDNKGFDYINWCLSFPDAVVSGFGGGSTRKKSCEFDFYQKGFEEGKYISKPTLNYSSYLEGFDAGRLYRKNVSANEDLKLALAKAKFSSLEEKIQKELEEKQQNVYSRIK